jgi:light-regulated signal transduction histidine kinase (bacteriophytochrome)
MERANNELQRYNRAITEEIRKPLELIGQYADSLRDKLSPSGDKESIESLKVIAQQCDRVLRLVRPINGDAETTVRHTAITLKTTDTWTSYNPPPEIINEAAQLHKREA